MILIPFADLLGLLSDISKINYYSNTCQISKPQYTTLLINKGRFFMEAYL
jgi:hypothetical protein